MSADARNMGGEAGATSSALSRSMAERVRALEIELAHARSLAAEAQASSESAARFRRIVETTAEGVWTIDASDRTTFVNTAMARMLGYTPEQMLGRYTREFLPEATRHQCGEKLARCRQGVSEVNEFAILHADGHELWALMTMSPIIDEAGNYQGALAMVTDATNKRRADREQAELTLRMVESQKMESLGVLAGGIAHDFNNLLAAIMGHVEIASQESHLSLRARTALTNALAAAQRAAGLTRQLLDYSGRGQVALRPLSLGAQTAEMVHILRASIPKRIEIDLTATDASLSIMADPDRLQQATMNLVLNAAEAYGNQPGTVAIRVGSELVEQFGSPPTEYVFLEVRDQGIGMDEETLKRVFDPFFTTKTSGRGLGLAATLGIVRTHGGLLTVQSKPGEGTCFRALFPRIDALPESEPPMPTPTLQRPPRARTLLVVDDEPMVREFAQRLLETEGYNVLEAGTGREALTLLRSRLPEIDGVLLDLSMPGMDGDTLLAELRAFAPELPVIVHSGHSLESTSERLTQWNIAGVLQKPYRAARLSEMVRNLFGGAKP
jgi:two-component system, cell cycle sensor histidine kinase and response regulator CckA